MTRWKKTTSSLVLMRSQCSKKNKPIANTIETIKDLTNEDTTKLVEGCLRSTFFTFQKEFYEQVEGVEMGLPLSPIGEN